MENSTIIDNFECKFTTETPYLCKIENILTYMNGATRFFLEQYLQSTLCTYNTLSLLRKKWS